MMDSPLRILYRAVQTDPPSLLDFTSNAAQGRPLFEPTPENHRLWTGLSCWATAAQARRNARRFRRQGDYIATIAVEAGAPIQVEKSRGPGHHTLWGPPEALLARVVSVEPL